MLRAERVPHPTGDFTRITPLSNSQDIAAALSAHKGYRKNRGRRPVDAARLRRVADLYREATKNGAPTGDYIASAEGVEPGTARSLVRRARAAGFLPAAPREEGGGS